MKKLRLGVGMYCVELLHSVQRDGYTSYISGAGPFATYYNTDALEIMEKRSQGILDDLKKDDTIVAVDIEEDFENVSYKITGWREDEALVWEWRVYPYN
jgi:hypothetical protein